MLHPRASYECLDTSSVESPPWSFIQWAITTIGGIVIFITGYAFRMRSKLISHEETINIHQKRIDKIEVDAQTAREILAKHPTRDELREDIRTVQATVENKFDQLNIRFDRLDSRIDAIRK